MRRLLVLLSVLLALLVGGCDSKAVMDTYSFGNQVIQAGPSEIIVPSPFELGYNATITSNREGYPIRNYAGMTKTFLVNVEAMMPSAEKALPTPEAFAAQAITSLKSTSGFKVRQAETTVVTLSGVPAYKQTVVYTGSNGVSFSFLRYVFLDKGILWNIVYQYPSAETDGKDIVQYVEDKIQITH